MGVELFIGIPIEPIDSFPLSRASFPVAGQFRSHSGQMMTAVAFLAQNPKPSVDQVVDAMSTNYCRCGCYTRIKRAVTRAAEIAQEQNPERAA